MHQNDYPSFAYGIVLLIFLLTGFYARRRYLNAPVFTYAAVWIAIFAVLAIAYTMKENIMQNLLPSHVTATDGVLSVKKANDGHFYVDAYLNGQKIHFLVDTGATSTVLKPQDARQLGIDLAKLSYDRQYSTANGIVAGATTTIESFKIGSLIFHDISVSVTNGELDMSLLGMNVLENFASYRFEGDVLYLIP
ncbi:MAG: TIGR02281 family clan AA aspartic protease [Rickettsiales bacterium]